MKRLHNVDHNGDGEVDLGEFAVALQQMDGTLTSAETHELYEFCVWNEDEELKIHLFAGLLQQRCAPKMDLTANIVLRRSFPDIFPLEIAGSAPEDMGKERPFAFAPGNKFSFIDYDKNEFTKHSGNGQNAQNGSIRSNGISKKMQNTHSLSNIADLGMFGGVQIKKRHSRAATAPHHQSAVSAVDVVKSRTRRRRSSSGGSMMMKGNCSVIVVTAMRHQLEEVDDNGDGRVDLEEFKEVCSLCGSGHALHFVALRVYEVCSF